MINFNREQEPEIYGKTLWMNPQIEFAIGKNIVEYDMQSASLSVSRRYKLLPEELIERLERMPKDKRTKEVGLMQRHDQDFSENMIKGLLQTRKEFLMKNMLTEDNVITLHSDAVIFIQKRPIIDKIGGVPFIMKNQWSSYIRYDRLEMFYGDGEVTYKGIPKQMLQQHTLGMCQYILNVFTKLECRDDSLYNDICVFQKKYLQEKLPEYYYIPFGKTGEWKGENLKFLAFMAQVIQSELR